MKINSNVIYVSPGYLLYQQQGTVMAQPFDANRLQLTGDPKPVAQGLEFNPFGGTGEFTASENGVLGGMRPGASEITGAIGALRSSGRAGEL